MTQEDHEDKPADRQPELVAAVPKPSLWRRLVNYFLTGFVLAGPIAITLYLGWAVIGWIDGVVIPLIPRRLNPASYLPFPIPGLGLIVAISVITLFGFLAANFIGRTLIRIGERIVERVPVLSSIHGALKQVFDTLITQRGTSFKQVALVEYPRRGAWSVVLIASEARGEVAHKIPDDDDIISVFMPTTPNPTSGFLMFVPRRDLILLDMGVEDAAKLIISTGLVSPAYVPGARSSPPRGPLDPE